MLCRMGGAGLMSVGEDYYWMGRSYECVGGAYEWRTGAHECRGWPTIKWAGLMSVVHDLPLNG